MVKYCPDCGEKLIDNAKFCKNCGAKLNGNVQAGSVGEPPVFEKSYTVHIVVAYILALLFPLFGAILAVYLVTRKDSESANRHGKYALIVAILMMAFSFLSVFR